MGGWCPAKFRFGGGSPESTGPHPEPCQDWLTNLSVEAASMTLVEDHTRLFRLPDLPRSGDLASRMDGPGQRGVPAQPRTAGGRRQPRRHCPGVSRASAMASRNSVDFFMAAHRPRRAAAPRGNDRRRGPCHVGPTCTPTASRHCSSRQALGFTGGSGGVALAIFVIGDVLRQVDLFHLFRGVVVTRSRYGSGRFRCGRFRKPARLACHDLRRRCGGSGKPAVVDSVLTPPNRPSWTGGSSWHETQSCG